MHQAARFAPSLLETGVQVSRMDELRRGCQRARPVVHAHAALVFFTGGGATIEQAGRWKLSAGDVMLVPAGMPHRLVEERGAVRWGLGFCTPCFAGELDPLLAPFERARAGGSAVVTIAAERRARFEALLGELEEAAPRNDRAGLAVKKGLLTLVLDEVGRAGSEESTSAGRAGAGRLSGAPDDAGIAGEGRGAGRDPSAGASRGASAGKEQGLVAQSLRFIERNCLGPLSLGELAAAMSKSPAHLTTVLRRATGKSAVQWIIAGRLAEARRLLTSSAEPVERIAERVGYADATHFIRLFRREHGVTPAAWRAGAR